MKRRRPRKWTVGGSKIELPGGQNGLLEVSGDSGVAGRRQVAVKTTPKPFLGSFWSALGSSWALWALLGAVLGVQEVPGSFREAPRLLEAILADHFGGQDGGARKLIDFVV